MTAGGGAPGMTARSAQITSEEIRASLICHPELCEGSYAFDKFPRITSSEIRTSLICHPELCEGSYAFDKFARNDSGVPGLFVIPVYMTLLFQLVMM